MSYILCNNDNYYSPGERLQTLFEELVVQPFENRPWTPEWEDHVKNQDFEYHRVTILDQGRTNFDEPFKGLPAEDKVLLYCLHYMPMHLYSSYHIFTKHLEDVGDKVVFIDFGCGPLTSGIAFWAAFAEHCDITYLGIDSSLKMLEKAAAINTSGCYGRFFTKAWGRMSWNGLSEVLDQYIIRDDQTQIIFNFCYFLASKTLKISDLCNCLTQIVAKYSRHKMYLIYQNPQSSYFHKNWHFLKTRLTQLSAFQRQVAEKNNFSYKRLTSGTHFTKFRFDILSNQSSNFSNNPY